MTISALSDIANLACLYDDTLGVYSDNGVTPAVDGDLVYKWNDQSGNGNHASQSTSGQRPTFKSGVGVVWNINDPTALRMAISGLSLDTRASTVFCVCGFANANAISCIFGSSSGSFFNNLNTGVPTLTMTGGGATFTPSPVVRVPSNLSVFTARYGASSAKMRVNGTQSSGSVLTAGTMSSIILGNYPSLSLGFAGRMRLFVAYSRELTDQEVADVEAYLYARYSVVTSAAQVIVFDGDSLTAGNQVLMPYPMQMEIAGQMPANTLYYNSAVSGQTLADMQTRGSTWVDGLWQSGKYNILVAWGGTNDLYVGGQNGSQTSTRLDTYLTSRKAASIVPKTLVLTTIARGTDVTIDGYRATFNTATKALASSKMDRCLDVAANTALDAIADTANTTYYKGDRVHLTDTGLGLISAAAVPALSALSPPTAVTPAGITAARAAHVARKYGLFVHFNESTFDGNQWATPNKTPPSFNPPSTLNLRNWCRVAKASGAQYAVLTVKHHDGFSLYNSTATNSLFGYRYDVSLTNWAAQARDIVSEFVAACAAEGLKVGLYFSIWDRTFEAKTSWTSGTDGGRYISLIEGQLSEILGGTYGTIDLLWCDMWTSSGPGFAIVPYSTIYNYVKNLQPNCLVIANTQSAYGTSDIQEYEANPVASNNSLAAEACQTTEYNTSGIDTNWFYGSARARNLFTLSDLANISLQTITYGGTMLLNLAPDTNGLLLSGTVQNYYRMGEVINGTNLAAGLTPTVSSTLAGGYAATYATNGTRYQSGTNRWKSAVGDGTPYIEVNLGSVQRVDYVTLTTTGFTNSSLTCTLYDAGHSQVSSTSLPVSSTSTSALRTNATAQYVRVSSTAQMQVDQIMAVQSGNAPVFTTQATAAVSNIIGPTVALTCVTDSPTSVTYAWTCTSKPLASAGVTFSASTSASTNVTFDAVGSYTLRCTATNAYGSTVSDVTVGCLSLTAGQYVNAVNADSPFAFWKLDEAAGSGTVADSSGGGRTGTVYSGVTLGSTGMLAGDASTSALFNGTSGYIDGATLGSSTTFTIEAIFTPLANTGGGQATNAAILTEVFSTKLNYFLGFNNAGTDTTSAYNRLYGGFFNGSWRLATKASTPHLTAGTAYHLAVTYDGTTVTLYVNGQSYATLNYTGTPTSDGTNFRIGRRHDLASTDYLKGYLQMVSFKKAALSAARILAHYQAMTVLPLVGGDLTAGTPTRTSVSLSYTSAIGGTGTVTAQLQRSTDNSTWSNVSDGTGLTAGRVYYFRVAYTDSASSPVTAYSNTVTVATPKQRGGILDLDLSL